MSQDTKNSIPPALLSELKNFPNQGAIGEIIEKNITGKVFKLPSEGILLVENCTDPFIFIAGPVDEASIENITSLASYKTLPMVYCDPQYHSLFIRRGWNFHFRTAMTLKQPDQLMPLDPAIHIEQIHSEDLLKQCACYEDIVKRYGTEQDFLTHGLGYVLRHGERIVSETYANMGGGFAEITVSTHPNFQSRGYATHVASHIIRECLNNNMTPQFSCNVENKAAINTGLKLGFEVSGYHAFLVPDWVVPHPLS